MKPFSIPESAEYYFCTDTIVGWQSVFASPPYFRNQSIIGNSSAPSSYVESQWLAFGIFAIDKVPFLFQA